MLILLLVSVLGIPVLYSTGKHIKSGRPSFPPATNIIIPACALCAAVITTLIIAPSTAAGAGRRVIVEISGPLTDQQQINIQNHLSLSRLTDDDPLSPALFNELYNKAKKETRKALEPFGYYTPEISLTHRLTDGIHHVVVSVDPGTPVTVNEVDITVVGPGQEDAVLRKAVAMFPLQSGRLLDHRSYEEGKDALVTQALDRGYQQARFRHSRVAVSTRTHSAVIHLQLDTGPQYRYGPLTFDTDLIDHNLLRKVIQVNTGDPFSPKSLTRLRQALFNTDYFKTADLEYDLDQSVDGSVPVKVALTPNPANKYGIGLGYGTDTGIRGTLTYANRYVNRLGHQLDMQLQPAERKNSLGSTYIIPIGDAKKDRMALAARYETEEFNNIDTKALNASVSHDHYREWGEFSTYVQFLDEQYSVHHKDDRGTLFIPGIKGSLFWADDRIATKKGLRLTASVSGSEDTILADTSFVQAALRAKAIYSFSDLWRGIGRADIGTTVVDDIQKLPPSLRYYAGGDQSVRGYGYKKIGPTDAEGNNIGGKNILTYSIELERTLFDAWSGAVFYDSGAAMNTFSHVSMRSGAGLGLRWNGIFGQVRLDVAKALDDGGSWRIHFTMGADL
ncbi:MAG: outer membrane protein assembly factor [Desulfobulbus sp.]|nr:outer membrane protein assembly factor [Desulfobulbus sp.]